jgi:hypothetical protein
MTGARDHEPVHISDLFDSSRAGPAERGKLCEVSNCSHVAFVSVRVGRRRRQLCLTHYEVLSHGFSGNGSHERTA